MGHCWTYRQQRLQKDQFDEAVFQTTRTWHWESDVNAGQFEPPTFSCESNMTCVTGRSQLWVVTLSTTGSLSHEPIAFGMKAKLFIYNLEPSLQKSRISWRVNTAVLSIMHGQWLTETAEMTDCIQSQRLRPLSICLCTHKCDKKPPTPVPKILNVVWE